MGKKRIAVFADGTWQAQDSANVSNIVLLKNAVKAVAADGTPQISAYHIGVGADTSRLMAYIQGAFGLGVSGNIKDLYRGLVKRYQGRADSNPDHDELYLFGFSRGAFTARSLGGLIRHCGILKPEHSNLVNQAYALYMAQDALHDPDSDVMKNFRSKYAWPEFSDASAFHVHFIGVFDTVGSLGVPITYKLNAGFHDTTLSPYVHHACQALAIDEQRGNFEPCLWQQHAEALPDQKLVQAWFPGVHSDIGGGYAETGLADCTLHWMADYARAAGLDLDTASFPDPNPDGTLHDSLTGLYKVMPAVSRPIGSAEPDTVPQRIHADTLIRMHWSSSYRPANLEDYLKAHVPPLLEPEQPATLKPRVSVQSGVRAAVHWDASAKVSTTDTADSSQTVTESTRPKMKRSGFVHNLGKKLVRRTVSWQEKQPESTVRHFNNG
ncbi:MAG TPA: DUF2235 domain-containing protein [Gammaproteobacteria bacterium]